MGKNEDDPKPENNHTNKKMINSKMMTIPKITLKMNLTPKRKMTTMMKKT